MYRIYLQFLTKVRSNASNALFKFLGIGAASSGGMCVLDCHLQGIMPALVISTNQQCLVWQMFETFTRFHGVWDLGSWSNCSIFVTQFSPAIKSRFENKALVRFTWIWT